MSMLRRLVLEWSIREISKKLNPANLKNLSGSPVKAQSFDALGLQTLEMLKRLKSIDVLQLLRFDSEEFAAILKVETKGSAANPEDLLRGMFEVVEGKVQFLEREKEGAYTYFITGKVPTQSPEMDSKKTCILSCPSASKMENLELPYWETAAKLSISLTLLTVCV